MQVQQGDIERGGIGNDVEVTAAGPLHPVAKTHDFWQMLARHSSIGIGEMLSVR